MFASTIVKAQFSWPSVQAAFTATERPSGDQCGDPDGPARYNRSTPLPSVFAVYVNVSSDPRGSSRAKTMRSSALDRVLLAATSSSAPDATNAPTSPIRIARARTRDAEIVRGLDTGLAGSATLHDEHDRVPDGGDDGRVQQEPGPPPVSCEQQNKPPLLGTPDFRGRALDRTSIRTLRAGSPAVVVAGTEMCLGASTEICLVLSDERFEWPSTIVVGDTAILVALVVDEVERDGKQRIHRLRLTQT